MTYPLSPEAIDGGQKTNLQEHLLRYRDSLVVGTQAASRVCAMTSAEAPPPASDKYVSSNFQEDEGVKHETEERRNEHLRYPSVIEPRSLVSATYEYVVQAGGPWSTNVRFVL